VMFYKNSQRRNQKYLKHENTQLRATILLFIKSRSESFVLSPEIQDRGEVAISNWGKHNETFYFE
jgi:hypothetical protein